MQTIKQTVDYKLTDQQERDVKAMQDFMFETIEFANRKLYEHIDPINRKYLIAGLFGNPKDQPIDYQI